MAGIVLHPDEQAGDHEGSDLSPAFASLGLVREGAGRPETSLGVFPLVGQHAPQSLGQRAVMLLQGFPDHRQRHWLRDEQAVGEVGNLPLVHRQ